MKSKEEFMKSIKITNSMSPKKSIQINYSYDEPYQLIEETHTIDLENGWEVTFTYSAEIYVSESSIWSYYDEPQSSVSIENESVEIHEVYFQEEEIKLDEFTEKALRLEILNNIE